MHILIAIRNALAGKLSVDREFFCSTSLELLLNLEPRFNAQLVYTFAYIGSFAPVAYIIQECAGTRYIST